MKKIELVGIVLLIIFILSCLYIAHEIPNEYCKNIGFEGSYSRSCYNIENGFIIWEHNTLPSHWYMYKYNKNG